VLLDKMVRRANLANPVKLVAMAWRRLIHSLEVARRARRRRQVLPAHPAHRDQSDRKDRPLRQFHLSHQESKARPARPVLRAQPVPMASQVPKVLLAPTHPAERTHAVPKVQSEVPVPQDPKDRTELQLRLAVLAPESLDHPVQRVHPAQMENKANRGPPAVRANRVRTPAIVRARREPPLQPLWQLEREVVDDYLPVFAELTRSLISSSFM